MKTRFEVVLVLEADADAVFFEAMGNPSEDILVEVMGAIAELDDVKLVEIEVETLKD